MSSEPRIALLPENVRNQIAAGEVVERPASAVKELIENSIDAGATRVEIDLEEGGARLVRISDNGCGMGDADLALCFLPHATSKLHSLEDLDHIASLGFRGEALASIGSVAKVRVFSRPPGAELGLRIENHGGEISAVREAGGPQGTSIEVRDLFYNTPARRRFLKRPSTELARCLEVVQRIALAADGVGFRLTHDGKRVLEVEADLDLRGRVHRLFGAELAEALIPVHAEHGDLVLSGYLGPPRLTRGDSARQMWFLNGRPLRDRVLTRILRDAYKGFLEGPRHPACFLSLSLDPARVDVNVHPTKSEVRFRDQSALFGFCLRSLREALNAANLATPGEKLIDFADRRVQREAGHPFLPDPGPRTGAGRGILRPESRPSAEVHEVPGRIVEIPRPLSGSPAAGAPQAPLSETAPEEQSWTAADDLSGPYLQVGKTYLLRAQPGGFEIVDQHALHERVTFEELLADVRRGSVEVQRQLVPELVEVSRAELTELEEHRESLAKIGIELSPFGETTVAVHALPTRVKKPDAAGIVRDVVEILARTGRPPESEEVLEEILHRTACRSSIMAGDELTSDEIQSLLERAREKGGAKTCPHGRPTRVTFTLADLEKAFQRR